MVFFFLVKMVKLRFIKPIFFNVINITKKHVFPSNIISTYIGYSVNLVEKLKCCTPIHVPFSVQHLVPFLSFAVNGTFTLSSVIVLVTTTNYFKFKKGVYRVYNVHFMWWDHHGHVYSPGFLRSINFPVNMFLAVGISNGNSYIR